MHKASVRREVAHFHEHLVGVEVAHVKAALIHVVAAAAEFEAVEFLDRMEAVFIPGEERGLEGLVAILAAEIEAQTLLGEGREAAAVIRQAGAGVRVLQRVGGVDPLEGGLYFRVTVDGGEVGRRMSSAIGPALPAARSSSRFAHA